MINKVALLSGEVEHVCLEGHAGVFRCSRVLNLKNHEKDRSSTCSKRPVCLLMRQRPAAVVSAAQGRRTNLYPYVAHYRLLTGSMSQVWLEIPNVDTGLCNGL